MDDTVRIYWRGETHWFVEPVTEDKLQSIVQIWEMTFTDYSLPYHAKKEFLPIIDMTVDDGTASNPTPSAYDESLSLQCRLDSPTETKTEFPRQQILDWWVQLPSQQFISLSCNGMDYRLIQRKFSREHQTAEWVSRSGNRVYYENPAFTDLLFGKSLFFNAFYFLTTYVQDISLLERTKIPLSTLCMLPCVL